MNDMGLAIDIDDTLADTATTCFQVIYQKYGHLSGVSLPDLVRFYHQPGNVPAWQTSQIQESIRQTMEDPDWLRQLPQIVGAQATLNRLSTSIPVSLYISSRLTHHQHLTETWLQAQGFPVAPVKLRTSDMIRPDWKMAFLAATYPRTYGLIDNELGFLPVQQHNYQGRLLWFNRYHAPTLYPNLQEFSDWQEIGRILKT